MIKCQWWLCEVWCVPSGTHVPLKHWSQNTVLSIKSVCYLIFWNSFAVYMPVDQVNVTTYAMHSSKCALSTLAFHGFRSQNDCSMSNNSHSTISHRQIYNSEYYSVKCCTKVLHIWQVRCAINLLYVEEWNKSLKNVY